MTPVFQGFPIRKSPDHSSFTSSPGLIAGYNVLHRLLVPRHPPIALSSLSKFSTKMLASTVQFSKYGRYHNHHPRKGSSPWSNRRRCKQPTLQDPTACHTPARHPPHSTPTRGCTSSEQPTRMHQSMFHIPEPTGHTTLGCETSRQ